MFVFSSIILLLLSRSKRLHKLPGTIGIFFSIKENKPKGQESLSAYGKYDPVYNYTAVQL